MHSLRITCGPLLVSPQENSAEELLRLTSKSLPDLTSSVEDVSSWTDNEEQEPDGEEDEGARSSSIQAAVSVCLWFCSLSVRMPEDTGARIRG